MRRSARAYFCTLLLSAALALSMIPTFAQAGNFPDINYLISVSSMTSGGWKWPPMGGPVQRYVKDISTGKTYLMQVDYWGTARVLAEH